MTIEETDETSRFEVTTSDMPVVTTDADSDNESQRSGQSEARKDDDPKGSSQEAEAKKSQEAEDTPKADEVDESGEKATAEDDKAEGSEAKEQKSKKPNRLQKRIDVVVREREDANRRAEAAEKRLEELENKGDKKPESAGKEAIANEPVESDFETYDEYLDALDKFDQPTPEKAEEKQSADTIEGEEGELTDAQRTAMAVIKDKVDQDAEKYSDFEDVALNPEVPITGEMLEALAECDDPAQVMYHLGQNKDLAAQIAEKSPAQQMREIAKLDLTVDVKPPKPTKTTQAADPIAPVGGSDTQEKPVNDLSFSEYETKMNKREQEGGNRW